jgi:acetyltransferase-like isoleucine patch superfamily enzyme
MKKHVKTFIAQLLWPEYIRNGGVIHSIPILFNCFVLQKLLRINSHVPWPVHYTTKVMSPEKIENGDRTPGLSIACHLDGRNGIKFGKNVWVGPRVSVISMNHDVQDYHKFINGKSVIIGDNCWLAANVVILPEVALGEHTVVAAGSVVTKSFTQGNVVLAGVPAKVVKELRSYKD